MLPSSTRRYCVIALMLITGISTCDTNGVESTILTRWKRSVNAEEHIGLESYGSKHTDNLLPRADKISPKLLGVVGKYNEENISVRHVRVERAGPAKRNKVVRRKEQLKPQRSNMDQEDSIHPILKVNNPLDYHKLVGMLNDKEHPLRHIKLNIPQQSSRATDHKGKLWKKPIQRFRNERKLRMSTESTQTNNIFPTSSTYFQSSTPSPFADPPVRGVTPITRAQTAVPKQKHEVPLTYKGNRPHSKPFANLKRTSSSIIIPVFKVSSPPTEPLSQQGRSHLGGEILSNTSNATEMKLPSFPLRSLFSHRNITVPNSLREQLDLVDEEKSRQVILLSDMFNKSLSKTWKLLIPHPKLSSLQNNETKTADDESWISFMSSKHEKLKKKKARAYTVSDYRPSAIGIGSVGALVLVAIVVGIIILDSSSLYRDARRLKRGIFSLCRPVYKHKLTASTVDTKGQKWAYVIHER